ncbi:MAG: hypothetical protein OEM03_05080 [Chromatiales bacterium]|nr:hypothetical protein [Chromatiales bacterium]
MFRGPLMAGLMSRLGRLRFPYLFGLTALVFLGDVLLPDLIPFVDEILLGLLTILFGAWRKKRHETPPGDEGPTAGNA